MENFANQSFIGHLQNSWINPNPPLNGCLGLATVPVVDSLQYELDSGTKDLGTNQTKNTWRGTYEPYLICLVALREGEYHS